MLKPKRKITKKEIRQDPLLETINELQHKFVEYKPWVIRVGTVLIVLVVVIILMQNWRTSKRLEGEAIFGRALVAYEQEDYENAQFQFEALTEEFGGFYSGKVGRYYLGSLAYNKAEYEVAEDHLTRFAKSGVDGILCKNSHVMLADIYKKTDRLEKVETELLKAVELSTSDDDKYALQLNLAKYYTNNGDIEKAEKLVEVILNDKEVPYNLKKQAEEISGSILK